MLTTHAALINPDLLAFVKNCRFRSDQLWKRNTPCLAISKSSTPQNCQLIFIDQQPQMAFDVQSIDRQTLKSNVVALAKAAIVFGIPTTIATVETESFSGHTYPGLLSVFPMNTNLERT